jgi:hypothetical protein
MKENHAGCTIVSKMGTVARPQKKNLEPSNKARQGTRRKASKQSKKKKKKKKSAALLRI